jgi:hypothetical protein
MSPCSRNRSPGLALAAVALLTLALPARAADGDEPDAGVASLGGADAGTAPPPPRRAVYLPESVRKELVEQLKAEVLAQAEKEGWAAPGSLPAWVKRFTLTADMRVRWEMLFFQPGNASTGEFPDFNAINSGQPFDVLGFDLANDRYLNVDQDRYRPRIQARLGFAVDLGAGFDVTFRLASGDGSTPVSTNQTLGGSAGDFSKYQLWIDRASLRFEPFKGQPTGLVVEAGRFGNPFMSTDLVWDEDLSFDGIALQGRTAAAPVGLFVNGGFFSYFNTPLDFPAEQPVKLPSFDKWLMAGQLGASVTVPRVFTLSVAGAFYYFDRIEGRVSGPCDTNLRGFTCDTDASRPAFAQKGNTYSALRTPSIAALTAEASGFAPEYQYFGLSSLFRELALTGRFELTAVPKLRVVLDLELVRNLGFSPRRIAPHALNNLGACDDDGSCAFAGGLNGYHGHLLVGSAVPDRQWSWSLSAAYRYLESDAVVDAFTESDFGLGGTNLKGFVLTGQLWLTDFVAAGARWMSADAISGPPFAMDTFHFDVKARY